MQGRSRNGSSKTGGGDIVEDGGFRRGEGQGDGRFRARAVEGVGDGRSKAGGVEGYTAKTKWLF